MNNFWEIEGTPTSSIWYAMEVEITDKPGNEIVCGITRDYTQR